MKYLVLGVVFLLVGCGEDIPPANVTAEFRDNVLYVTNAESSTLEKVTVFYSGLDDVHTKKEFSGLQAGEIRTFDMSYPDISPGTIIWIEVDWTTPGRTRQSPNYFFDESMNLLPLNGDRGDETTAIHMDWFTNRAKYDALFMN